MNLGILVTTDRHKDAILGLSEAAIAKGHTVSIFIMDVGNKLLLQDDFRALCGREGITMSYCDHSAKTLEISTEGIPAEIVCGSQFNNANMMHDVDKVINL